MKIKKNIKVKSISGLSSLLIGKEITSVVNVLKNEFIDISNDYYKYPKTVKYFLLLKSDNFLQHLGYIC